MLYMYVCMRVCICVCLFVCRWVLNCSGEYHTCLLCGIHVACDSRYTLSTVRKLTPRAVTVLSIGLSIVIIILPAFFSVSKNILTLQLHHLCVSTNDVYLWYLLKWSLS